MVIPVHFLFIPVLLLLSAVFASAEASLFSLTRPQLETLRKTKPRAYTRIRYLIFRPEELLSTLIISNEFLNILIGTLVAALVESEPGSTGLMEVVMAVLISSLLLLTCSEILPKIIAFRLPVLTASLLAYPTSWAHFILTPLRKIFLGVSGTIIRACGIKSTPPAALNEQDFLTLVEIGAESGSLDRDEKEMIFNVFRTSDQPVSAVMTPWSQVFTVPDNLDGTSVFTKINRQNFSRVPVLAASDGRVVGILYMKELLRLLPVRDRAERVRLMEKAIFPPYIVSTHKKIPSLFREFKLKKIHFALVVDEYGRQIGVVTLQDLLNALFRTHKIQMHREAK